VKFVFICSIIDVDVDGFFLQVGQVKSKKTSGRDSECVRDLKFSFVYQNPPIKNSYVLKKVLNIFCYEYHVFYPKITLFVYNVAYCNRYKYI
jgi:hypothetical protein